MAKFGKTWKDKGSSWKFYYLSDTKRVLYNKNRGPAGVVSWYNTEFTQTKRRGKWTPRMR